MGGILLINIQTTAEDASDKILLAAKKIRKVTSTDFVISLVADDFSCASNTYVGKVRQGLFKIPSQPPNDAAVQSNNKSSQRFHVKQLSPGVPACNYSIVSSVHCVMHSIPMSSIQEGSTASTPTSLPNSVDEINSSSLISEGKEPVRSSSSSTLSNCLVTLNLVGS